MILLRIVPSDPASLLTAQARTLFTQYGEFLRRTQACGTFNFHRYDDEIATLPNAYADHHGEVLLALVDEVPAACIAWRDALTGPPGFVRDPTGRTGEIKRLFVAEAFRGHGLARTLIVESLSRLAARGYTRIVLDTDQVHMPAALGLYRTFGFREYAPAHGNIIFLDLMPGTAPSSS